eukprot:COSAG01_NODE_6459_length_3657_cov_2.202923_4_plen_80_part_00
MEMYHQSYMAPGYAGTASDVAPGSCFGRRSTLTVTAAACEANPHSRAECVSERPNGWVEAGWASWTAIALARRQAAQDG